MDTVERKNYSRGGPRLTPPTASEHCLLYKYGLTKEAHDKIVKIQEGLCPICLKALKDGTRMVVDHCHKTGLVRGILHDHCNIALGKFEDSPIVLRRAANYLESRHLRIRKLICPRHLARLAAKSTNSIKPIDNKAVISIIDSISTEKH